jgi:SAM-dependent methyltransferase
MRNINQWKPIKFVVESGKLFPSLKQKEIGFSNRLITYFIASVYEQFIPKYCNDNLIDIECGNIPRCLNFTDIIADLNIAPIPELVKDSFDSAICSDVLEHIYDPKTFLREIHLVLKHDGILLLNVPFAFPLHESPYDYYRYTEWTLKRFMKESGFEIITFESLGEIVATWIPLTTRGFCGFGFIGGFIAAIIQNISCFLLRFKLSRQFLSYRSNLVPLGYFVASRKL